MPSNKPKLQIYIDPDVEPHLKEWRANREPLTDSAALNELLREFFGIHKEQGIEVFDWRWAIREAIAPVLAKIEAIERQLATGDEVYSASFSELEIKFEAIDKRIGEIEAQFQQERESPQLGINQEAMETVWMQEEVIKELQAEIDSLKESPEESPEEISLEDCQEKAIAILEAQFGQLSKAKLEAYPESQLMDIIFITSPLLNIEQAEEILRRILAAIPAAPPLHEIIGEEEGEVELNLEGDSPEESPRESLLEELSHGELVQRLKTNKNTLRSKRNQPDFASWAQQRDNQGLIWHWDGQRRIYQGFKASPV